MYHIFFLYLQINYVYTKSTIYFLNYTNMDLINQIVERAKANKQRIVLPEGTEERTLKAADRLLADEVVEVILIGNPDEIKALAEKHGLTNIDKATIIDPINNPRKEVYANLLFELR